MSFRTKLLSHKPQITEITLMGENYYSRWESLIVSFLSNAKR